MSDNVLTILIICITVVIVLIIFRNKLKSISVKGKEWIFKMKTHETLGIDAKEKFEKKYSDPTISQSIKDNKIVGNGNEIGINSSIKLK